MLRASPGAVEADLLPIFPNLPDPWDWRDGFLSFRRLLVIVSNLGDDSAVARVERDGPPWTVTDQLLDEIRRNAVTAVTREMTPPHPLSPLARHAAAAEAKAAERRRAAKVRFDARVRAREIRLAAEGNA